MVRYLSRRVWFRRESGDAPVGKQGGVKFSRQYSYQLRHRELGLCRLCSDPTESGYKTHCARHRLSTSSRPHWPEDKRQRFITLWNTGMSDWEIGQEFMLKKSAVYAAVRRLKKAGYRIASRGDHANRTE